MVKIKDVEQFNNGTVAGHSFTIHVCGTVDNNARLQWFEKTTRTYQGGPSKEKEWEDVFLKNTINAGNVPEMFENAKHDLDDVREMEDEEKADIEYEVKDRPVITIAANNSRILEFLIGVQLNETEKYLAACRQTVTINSAKLVECYEFVSTGFVQIDENERLDFYKETLEEVIEKFQLGVLR